MDARRIQGVVDRMRLFFVGTGLKSASQEVVEKWAREIERLLKETK